SSDVCSSDLQEPFPACGSAPATTRLPITWAWPSQPDRAEEEGEFSISCKSIGMSAGGEQRHGDFCGLNLAAPCMCEVVPSVALALTSGPAAKRTSTTSRGCSDLAAQ